MGSAPTVSAEARYLMTSQVGGGVVRADWACEQHLRRDRCYTTLRDATEVTLGKAAAR